jgi:predicted transcriptional regulator
MEKTTLYLPAELRSSLEALAKQTGRSQAELILEAVDRYIRQQEPPISRFIGIVQDGSLKAEDVEDWLAENWQPD